MTKVYGFVAEFNPFHNGHKLFIDQIKQKYHPEVLIAVMSGNFVQRGDFSVLSKWQRAQVAINNGVDLVIELPFAYAVEPAQYFAQGAIALLNLLKIDTLVFGTENQLDFEQLSTDILQAQNNFQQNYQLNSAQNLTQYYQSLGIEIDKLPNQLLGLNYVTQIKQQQLAMDVKTIQRLPSNFSATKIRQNMTQGSEVTDLVPLEMDAMLQQTTVDWDDYFPFLKYQILSHSPAELRQVYQMVEGLEFKLKKEVVSSENFAQFIERIKSKRYTMARLRRLLMYTLMNVTESEINNVYKNPYLRVLGFDKIGQEYLSILKKDIKPITRVGKLEKQTLDLEIRADQIRQLITHKEQNFGVIPYMKGVN